MNSGLAQLLRQASHTYSSRLGRQTPVSSFRVLRRSFATIAGPSSTSIPFRTPLQSAFPILRFFLLIPLGILIGSGPVLLNMTKLLHPASDAESLTLFTPSTPAEQAHQDFINSLPLVASLRADPAMSESRPHLKIPAPWSTNNLTAGTLRGPGMIEIPPYAWADKEGKKYVQIMYIGTDLCGHPGIVHGGFLATLLDEGLARCCFAALPNKVGVTAKLEVSYTAPCFAGQYIVLTGETTKVEGRKAWVSGTIETIVKEDKNGEGEVQETEKEKQSDWGQGKKESVVVAKAEALYIEPREAAMLSKFYTHA